MSDEDTTRGSVKLSDLDRAIDACNAQAYRLRFDIGDTGGRARKEWEETTERLRQLRADALAGATITPGIDTR